MTIDPDIEVLLIEINRRLIELESRPQQIIPVKYTLTYPDGTVAVYDLAPQV